MGSYSNEENPYSYMITRAKYFISRMVMWLYSLFHGIEKKVVCISYSGKLYADSPKEISEKLHELYPDFKVVWRINRLEDQYGTIPSYVKVVSSGIKFLFELATCFCYITNGANLNNLYKRKGQFWIQTWHGDFNFKKVLHELDTENFSEPITDEFYTDLCVAGCEFGVSLYHDAFHYNKEILKVGMPRNDRLIIRDKTKELYMRELFGISPDSKILLFAPTFRDHIFGIQDITVDLVQCIDSLEMNGNTWTCLIRAHPHSMKLNFECDNKKFIDVTCVPDMSDILPIVDLLITDYSSCANEIIRGGNGAILAAFDYEDYIKNNREFVIDLKQSGFIIAMNQEELNNILMTYTEDDYRTNAKELCEKYGMFETGNSAEIICNRINEKYYKYFGGK